MTDRFQNNNPFIFHCKMCVAVTAISSAEVDETFYRILHTNIRQKDFRKIFLLEVACAPHESFF